VLTFDISPLTTDACKDGGWQTFGSWKNQGDCVSYIASDDASGGS
jgi:hypothetical protein